MESKNIEYHPWNVTNSETVANFTNSLRERIFSVWRLTGAANFNEAI